MPELLDIAETLHRFAVATWPKTTRQSSDLSFMEFLALDHLAKEDKASVGEVKKAIQALPAQMSRMVRALEDKGYVRSQLNREDKRKIDLTLTKAGLKAHDTLRRARLNVLVEALGVLNNEEREQLHRMALKMESAFAGR